MPTVSIAVACSIACVSSSMAVGDAPAWYYTAPKAAAIKGK